MNRTAMHTLDILELIADNNNTPMGTSEISRRLGYPKSSVHDILSVLLKRGYIKYANEEMKTFCLGGRTLRIGMRYFRGIDLHKIAYPKLEKIRDEVDETVNLATEDNGEVIYIHSVHQEVPFRSTYSGSIIRSQLTVTALGKAILAGYPIEKVKRLTEGRFEKRTKNSITSFEPFCEELQRTARRGYAVENGENDESYRCVAVPLRDSTDRVIAAISVSVLDRRFTEEKKQLIIRVLRRRALEISHELGYMKDYLYPEEEAIIADGENV